MLGRNRISGHSEPALPFPACSRGSSGTEMKAPGKGDKQENSSEQSRCQKQPGEDGTGDERESAGGFGVTCRRGWSCHRATVTLCAWGEHSSGIFPHKHLSSVLPSHSQKRGSKPQESPRNPALLLWDSFLLFTFASASSLLYFGPRQGNGIIPGIPGSSVLP